jgi:hypothetical protein
MWSISRQKAHTQNWPPRAGLLCFQVRVARHRVTAKLAPKPPKWQLEAFVAQEVEKVQVGDAASVTDFVRSFGSHYIASYVTGNSLYQVQYCAHFELYACKLHFNRTALHGHSEGQLRFESSHPIGISPSPTRAVRLWGPPSLLCNG